MNSSSGAVGQVAQMDSDTKEWLFAAAQRAKMRYPGAIGELLSQELLSWMVFGHQLGSDLIMRVADDLLVGEESPSSTGRADHPMTPFSHHGGCR